MVFFKFRNFMTKNSFHSLTLKKLKTIHAQTTTYLCTKNSIFEYVHELKHKRIGLSMIMM